MKDKLIKLISDLVSDAEIETYKEIMTLCENYYTISQIWHLCKDKIKELENLKNQ